MKILLALMLCLLWLNPAHAFNIALFGDSITRGMHEDQQKNVREGWTLYPLPTDMNDQDPPVPIYSRMGGGNIMRYDTKSNPVCGVTSMYACVERVMSAHEIDYMVFMVSGNDMRWLMNTGPPDFTAYYGFTTEADVDVYIEKYLALIRSFRADFPTVKLIVGFYFPWTTATENPTSYTYSTAYGPVDDVKVNCTDTTTCTAAMNSNTGYLIKTITPMLQNMGIPVMDIRNLIIYTRVNPDSWHWANSTDGVHMSPSGEPRFYELFQDELYKVIVDKMVTVK